MKNIYFERLGIILAMLFFVFSSYIFITRADLFDQEEQEEDSKYTGIYYYTNSVNTSPEELGNYFYDEKYSEPASEVPDFNTQEVIIVSETIFDGDAILIGSSENNGTINGNAVFIGDQSENYGTVSGTITRRYEESIATEKDFTANDERWIVIADGVEVDITGATYSDDTTFVGENGGSFISDMNPITATISGSTLTLDYNRILDSQSVPSINDFSVTVNREVVIISSITISNEEIQLFLEDPVISEDEVIISYIVGDNLFFSDQGLNAMPFNELVVTNETPAVDNNDNDNDENNEEENQLQEEIQASRVSSGGSGVFPFSSLKLDIEKEYNKKVQTEKVEEIIEEKEILSNDELNKELEIKSSSQGSGISETTKDLAQKSKESIEITEKLKNTMLLAVEDKGTIWYVAPTDSKRYEVSSTNALNLFRKVTLGITNKNLEQIPLAGSEASINPLAKRLTGRFLLQVESRGESWYVDNTGYRHRVNADNLVETVKNSVQGINNQNLSKIPTSN